MHKEVVKTRTPRCQYGTAPAKPPESIIKTRALSQTSPDQYTVVIKDQTCQAYILQEVLARASPACWNCTPVVGHRAENLEVWLQILAERHDGGDVAAAVAVVGC